MPGIRVSLVLLFVFFSNFALAQSRCGSLLESLKQRNKLSPAVAEVLGDYENRREVLTVIVALDTFSPVVVRRGQSALTAIAEKLVSLGLYVESTETVTDPKSGIVFLRASGSARKLLMAAKFPQVLRISMRVNEYSEAALLRNIGRTPDLNFQESRFDEPANRRVPSEFANSRRGSSFSEGSGRSQSIRGYAGIDRHSDGNNDPYSESFGSYGDLFH